MDHSRTPLGTSSGLESQLRDLIISNNPSAGVQNGAARLSDTGSAGAVQSHNVQTPNLQLVPPGTTGISGEAAQQKAGKKRLNQAQRRQMASQLSVAVDTRPSQESAYAPRGRGQQWRGGHQGHVSGTSDPEFGSGRGMGGRGRGQHHDQFYPTHGSSRGGSQGFRQPREQKPYTYGSSPQSTTHQGSSYSHYSRRPQFGPEEIATQAELLSRLCYTVVAGSEIDRSEIAEKENFRIRIEHLIRQIITNYEQEQAQRWDFPSPSVELKCFGSLSSGFATKASDMDLALTSPLSRVQPDEKSSPIPRLIEKALLEAGIGARLLTRTRVPIIKLCEKPPQQLYSDLLTQREKWEKGLDTERQEDPDHDDLEHDDQGGNVDKEPNESPKKEHVQEDPEVIKATEFEVPSLDGTGFQKLYLRQSSNSSLVTYYATAKKVLRKTGVRDPRGPSIHTMTEMDWEVLRRVSHSFVAGLADTELRDRLRMYPSFSATASQTPSSPKRYALMTTFTQVEGEHAYLLWTRWKKRESIQQDSLADGYMYNWTLAQNKAEYGADPIAYNKELQTLLDQMKRVPSIQLVLLEQGAEESPMQYFARTRRLLEELKLSPLSVVGGIEKSVIGQYVSGISFKEVRVAVGEFISSSTETPTLDAVARRHMSLQLARGYNRALEKGLYDTEQANEVKAYIELLRSPLRRTTKGHSRFDMVVPLTKKDAPLFAKIKTLDDPHRLAPNQPKSQYKDSLEFPKTGAGVQCDINFSAHLALQNTILLRCYSHSDQRVRPMVLFIKHWAKVRGINSGYRGTLSSYGYVMMVLHYLINVARPFVCPNLQQLAPPPPPHLSPEEVEASTHCRGYFVNFWRNEQEIMHLASMNQLNHNTESLGHLLRGFFEYYAQSGFMSSGNGKGFDWGRDVVSIRSPGGLLSKQAKGWTGAKTVYEGKEEAQGPGAKSAPTSASAPKGDDVKEVRLRYLFAIEDPFETDHNVARTVTHNGIVSIRDEFRRAWRIIKEAGTGNASEDLLQELQDENKAEQFTFADLLYEIHGSVEFDDEE